MDDDDEHACYVAAAALGKICASTEIDNGIVAVEFGVPREGSRLASMVDFKLLLVGRKLSYGVSADHGKLNLVVQVR
jgi:hypothetical protein